MALTRIVFEVWGQMRGQNMAKSPGFRLARVLASLWLACAVWLSVPAAQAQVPQWQMDIYATPPQHRMPNFAENMRYNTLTQQAQEADATGDTEALAALIEESIGLFETTYGETHPATAMNLLNGAMTLQRYNLFADSQELVLKAETAVAQSLEPGHPLKVAVIATKAQNLVVLGGWEAAGPAFEAAYAELDLADPVDAETRSNLNVTYGSALLRSGQHAEGRQILLDEMDAIEAKYSAHSFRLVSPMDSLITSYLSFGETEAAQPLLERKIGIESAFYGPTHSQTLYSKFRLATLLNRTGQGEAALALSEELLSAAEALESTNPLATGQANASHGATLMMAGRPVEAIPYFERAIALLGVHASPEAVELVDAEGNLAICQRASGDLKGSEQTLLASHDRIAQSLPADHPLQAAIRQRLAQHYSIVGDDSSASKYAVEGLEIVARLPPGFADLLKADLLLNKATAAPAHQLAEARSDLEEALAIYSELNGPMIEDNIRFTKLLIAQNASEQDDLETAERLALEVLEALPEKDMRRPLALALLSMAAYARNDPDQALAYQRERVLLENEASVQMPGMLLNEAMAARSQVGFLTSQAGIAVAEDNLDLAMVLFDEALQICNRHPNELINDKLFILLHLSTAHAKNADMGKARDALISIVSAYDSDIQPEDLSLLSMASFMAAMFGELDVAADGVNLWYQRYSFSDYDPDTEIFIDLAEAYLSFLNEDLETARLALERAPEDSVMAPMLDPLMRAIKSITLAAEGDHEKAYETAASSGFQTERSASRGISEQMAAGRVKRDTDNLLGAIVIGSGFQLYQSAAPEARQAYFETAFEYAQANRLREASTAFEQGYLKTLASDAGIREQLDTWRAAEQRITALNFKVSQLISSRGAPEQVEAIEDERISALKEAEQASGAIRDALPALADIAGGKPVSVSEVRDSLLGPDEVLIVIFSNPNYAFASSDSENYKMLDRSYVFAITQEGTAWDGIGLSSFRTLTDILALHESFATASGLARGGPVESVGETAGYPVGAAAELHEAIFGSPEIRELSAGKKYMTIVASGAFASIPFPALIDAPGTDPDLFVSAPEELREMNWFGLRQAISVAPSVQSIKFARNTGGASRTTLRTPFFGIGAPRFSGAADDDLQATAEYFQKRSSNAAAVNKLPALPHTATEIRSLAAALGAKPGSFLLDSEATEAELRRFNRTGELGRADVIAFATHGLLGTEAEDYIGEPALALTPPTLNGEEENPFNDGLLTASEATELDISANWVLLSACNTAAGDKPGAEQLSGLASGFLAAGAKSLLVSHYPVFDDAAADLTINAVSTAKEQDVRRSEALRLAMKDIMMDTSRDGTPFSRAHPSFWAPFILIDPS